MKKALRGAALVLVSVVLLSGCLQSQITVMVSSDGAGQVERTFVMKHEIVEMLAGMSGSTPEDFELYEDGELEEEAASMGPGVTLASVEPINSRFGRGYKATFAFDDVNELRVNQNPGDAMPTEGGSGGGEEAVEVVTFSLERGNPAVLTVAMPQSDMEDGEQQDMGEMGEGPSQEDLEQMSEFYQDMRIGFSVEVLGSIVDTNATYREGNTVTLMDMDFNQILEDSEAMQRLIQSEADSLVEVQELTENTPGVTVEFQEEVTVRFAD